MKRSRMSKADLLHMVEGMQEEMAEIVEACRICRYCKHLKEDCSPTGAECRPEYDPKKG